MNHSLQVEGFNMTSEELQPKWPLSHYKDSMSTISRLLKKPFYRLYNIAYICDTVLTPLLVRQNKYLKTNRSSE